VPPLALELLEHRQLKQRRGLVIGDREVEDSTSTAKDC
jgi:hypothetical protein